MRKVVVGVTIDLNEVLLDEIASVSQEVEVRPLGPLVQEAVGSGEARIELDSKLAEVEALFFVKPQVDIFAPAKNLRWAHCHSAGVEWMFGEGKPTPHFTVTNTQGVVDVPIAEHCFMFMLNFVKNMTDFIEHKRKGQYVRQMATTGFLEGKTLGVLGLGGIGAEVARLGKAFRMRVLANRRSATRQSNVDNVDEMFPRENLHQLLPECDFVVVALPLTNETRHYLGAPEFAVMKSTAFVVNVGRGEIIDEAALVSALQRGSIGGAGMDVFEVEPLAEDSGLWRLPNVQITTHVAGSVTDKTPRAVKTFCANLLRYLRNEPLESIVDPVAGY